MMLHPYQNVKGPAYGLETGNTAAVMDGEIDDFIEARSAGCASSPPRP